MKTLGSPYVKIVLQRNDGDRGGFHSRREANIPTNYKQQVVSFWPSKKLVNAGFLRLVTLKFKGTYNVRASSSSSSSTPSQMNLEIAETEDQETHQLKRTVHVKFLLQKECSFGEQFMIVGDDPMFGVWDPERAIPMNWSDGHVWIVELDVPTEKSIQYKFILKGITGAILWQPGPDRILKTWMTDRNIIVCEDWENAALQKTMEEDPLSSQDDAGPAINSDMLIVADILNRQGEDFASEMDNGTIIPNVNPHLEKQPIHVTQEKPIVTDNIAHLEKQPILVTQEKPIVTDNIARSQEKPVATVADNIGYLKEDPTVNTKNEVLGENRMNQPMEAQSLATLDHTAKEGENFLGSVNTKNEVLGENRMNQSMEAQSLATLDHTAKEGENFLGTNGRVPTFTNSSGTVVQEILITHEGDPVLVPGLSPVLTVQSETTNLDEGERSMAFDASLGNNECERSIAFDASLGDNEVKNHNLPESDVKRETQNVRHQVEKTEEFDNKQQLPIELNNNPVAEDGILHESEPVDSSILDKDIQWGQKTLRKLLTSFGLL